MRTANPFNCHFSGEYLTLVYSLTSDISVEKVDFHTTCPDRKVKILEKYQYLFRITSWFSSGQVKFGVNLNSLIRIDKLE